MQRTPIRSPENPWQIPGPFFPPLKPEMDAASVTDHVTKVPMLGRRTTDVERAPKAYRELFQGRTEA